MSKKIGIIDADLLDNGTRHPNLALMKLSAFYKDLGDNVSLILNYNNINEYDKIFMSKVFSFTNVPNNILNIKNIEIGGTGFYSDGGQDLPYEIEHHMPDYNLYDEYISMQIEKGKKISYYADYLNYSIGFLTRGCFRKCSFCVNKKYDRVQRHALVSEFLDVDRRGIYLWDDNFLGFNEWESALDELEMTNKPFQFRQGLDVRLIDENKAKRFSKTKYHGDFIFAFDFLSQRQIIEEKLALWKKHCNKTTKLYVLCAYESQGVEDIVNTFERIKILMNFGCLPYIMRYEKYKSSRYKSMYIQLARWCNQPQFFKKKSFREFCEANQSYHKNSDTLCSAYRAMVNFERENPEIAKLYFDLRFDELNKYN